MDRVELIAVLVTVAVIVVAILLVIFWRPFSPRPHGEGSAYSPGEIGSEPSHFGDVGGGDGGGGH